MSFVYNIYNIFINTSEPEERFNDIKELYKKRYASCIAEADNVWEKTIPLVKEMVNLEFEINTLADCISQGRGKHEVFVHLESKINHNKELIKLLLAIAGIWHQDVYFWNKFKFCNLDGNNESIQKFIKSNREHYRYQGDLLKDIIKACKDNESDKDLYENHYYYYLKVDDLGTLSGNRTLYTQVSLYKVIIW